MRAMILETPRSALVPREIAEPRPDSGGVVLQVSACAVCRTDLHVIDGELPRPKLPLVLGHEVVGRIEAVGADVKDLKAGDRVGVPWLGWACGECDYCRSGRENLCPRARFTGYTLDGGYAERLAADARFVFPIPEAFSDEQAAPLLCAGLIGYRSYRRVGNAKKIGLYGFGAAAHLVTQLAAFEGRRIYAFTRDGDTNGQAFAQSVGACWAGGSSEEPPDQLDAALIFAPVGSLVPKALAAVVPGGCVVCGGIHMSDIPSFPYAALWQERSLASVANLTRKDGQEFLPLASKAKVRCRVKTYPLFEANTAIASLRNGAFNGAHVLLAE